MSLSARLNLIELKDVKLENRRCLFFFNPILLLFSFLNVDFARLSSQRRHTDDQRVPQQALQFALASGCREGQSFEKRYVKG